LALHGGPSVSSELLASLRVLLSKTNALLEHLGRSPKRFDQAL
jgi:hypothetical protein